MLVPSLFFLLAEPTPHDNACRNGSGNGIRVGMYKREYGFLVVWGHLNR